MNENCILKMFNIDPLIREYIENELKWNKFLEKNYKNIDLVYGWQKSHRVILHEKKIIKIQNIGKASNIPLKSRVINEHYIYKLMNNRIFHYDAKFKSIESQWNLLQLNFFEGTILESLLRDKIKVKHLIIPLLLKVIKLSFLGIHHPQLRSRHFLISKENSVCIIDFGGAIITNKLDAFIKNFGLHDIKNSKFLYVIKQLLFGGVIDLIPKFQNKNLHSIALASENENEIKDTKLKTFIFIRKIINKNITSNYDFKFLPSFYLGDFYITGSWHLEPIRNFLCSTLKLTNKKILIFNDILGILTLFLSFNKNLVTSYVRNNKFINLGNTILKTSSLGNKILSEPKHVSKLFKNFDFVIYFDFTNEFEFKDKWFQYQNFHYVSSVDKSKLINELPSNSKIKCIYENELYVYKISKL